ncbi:MAG: hypothetical protein IKE31_09225, partial [Eubacterium sp.]|nr:hypothetical protein [Eubacterium sp.]
MTLKYEILKRLVKAVNIKKMWTGMSTEELLENRRKQNAKNRIPNLKDDAFDISRIEIMGCPVLKLIHRKKADKANLFLIGGGMISAPRPGSIKKALRFAKETGLDVFVPYYPMLTTAVFGGYEAGCDFAAYVEEEPTEGTFFPAKEGVWVVFPEGWENSLYWV